MKKEFEKHAKEELSQHEVHVDVEALWDNVAPHVQKKKKRNFLFWFWTLGASLLIVGIGLWFALGQNAVDKKAWNHTTISTEKSSTETKENPSTNSFTEREIKKTEVSNKINQASTSETNVNDFTQVENTKNLNHLPKGKSPEYQKIEKRNSISATTLIDQATANVIEDQYIEIHLNPALNTESTFAEKVETHTGNLEKTKLSILNKTPSLLQKISKLNLPIMAMETILWNGSVVENIDREEPSPYQSKFPRRSSSKSKIKFGLGLYGGIGWANTSMETNYGPDRYQILREESEKDLEHLQLGLSGMVKIKNKFSLRAGLEYNRLGSKFERQVSDNIIDSIPNGVREMFVNQLTNDTIFTYGLVVNTESDFIDKQTYNYYHQIDVPVLIGYHLNKNKWSIGVEAGAVFNLAFRRKGDISKYNGRTYYDIKKDRDEWYTTNLGIAPLVQLNVAYQLNDHFQLHASPYYRFKSVYSTEVNPIKEKRAVFGLQMGGRYWF